jgi:CRP-like cAMP-binding protein
MHNDGAMSQGSVDPAVVGRLSVFAGLGEASLRRVAALAVIEEHAAGSILFRESDPSADVLFALEGRVSLSMRLGDARHVTVLSLGPGELVGWSAMFEGSRRVASARVTEAASLLRLPGRALRDLCEADHDVGYAVMRQLAAVLAQRLHDTRLQLMDMFGKEQGA